MARVQARAGGRSRRALAHVLEGDAELIEIDLGRLSADADASRRVELEASAARRELVPRDAWRVRRVDEELALRDAHGQDVGHVS